MPGDGSDVTARVDGHRIALTNLDKPMYPSAGVTKRDVVAYYAAVSAVMVPHLADRPVTRKRWPGGVGEAPFFEKNLGRAVPGWVTRRTQHHRSGSVEYPVVDSPATLVWLAQLAALELHVPQWRFARDGRRENPDRLVLDLDPGPGATLADCAVVARAVRDLLGQYGSGLVPVTSGSKGIHLYLGLNGAMTSDEASEWARRLARTLERAMPELVVSRMERSMRQGKVLIDWSQNNAAKTTVAPYSLRGRESPTVAAPREWEELDDPELCQLDFRAVLDRVRARGDPMAGLGRLPGVAVVPGDPGLAVVSGDPGVAVVAGDPGAAAVAGVSGAEDDGEARGSVSGEVGGAASGGAGSAASSEAGGAAFGGAGSAVSGEPHEARATDDRLHVYRSRRSADRTPEPVPDVADARPVGRDDTFVVQEHHARRLHWDFRLERGGVLVSWAVPKGLPTDDTQNRLAVRTEDHPLEYAAFAGSIPKGEYGGGEVAIWDAGTYVTEKWLEDEIIVVLHGARVRGRFVLVRTDDPNWLMRRMKDQTGVGPGTSPDGMGAADAAGTAGSGGVAAGTAGSGATGAGSTGSAGVVTGSTGFAGSGGAATGTAGSGGAGVSVTPGPPDPRLPRGISPMLATPGAVDDLGDGVWRCEAKWDGIRAIVDLDRGALRVRSRSGNDLTASYPELGEMATRLASHAAVLDGEIVVLGRGGAPRFEALQQRMGLRGPAEVRAAIGRIPVHYFAFDLLYLDGVSLLGKSYDDRRRLLEALDVDTAHCTVPAALAGTPAEAFAESRRRDLEGIVVKRADSTYRPGSRSGAWVKVKHRVTQDVVVVGWRPGRGRREGGIGSLLVALPEGLGGSLRYAGRVGTGFTDAMLSTLRRRLEPLRRATSPVTGSVPDDVAADAVWVSPKVVGVVTYAEITGEGRLRQPTWRGVREDVPADQVRREG